jgi:hypothetical protein
MSIGTFLLPEALSTTSLSQTFGPTNPNTCTGHQLGIALQSRPVSTSACTEALVGVLPKAASIHDADTDTQIAETALLHAIAAEMPRALALAC